MTLTDEQKRTVREVAHAANELLRTDKAIRNLNGSDEAFAALVEPKIVEFEEACTTALDAMDEDE